MKVLLVEDNSNIRESLEYSFSENNIDLVSKSCINDTIEYLEYNKVDAVILDVTLPDGNGFDLYKLLKTKFDIQMELAETYVVLGILAIGTKKNHLSKLIEALKQISKEHYKKDIDYPRHAFSVDFPFQLTRPRSAYHAPGKKLLLEDADNQISKESIMIYPPGIPLIVPGEVFTKELIERIKEYKKSNVTILSDYGADYVSVIDTDNWKYYRNYKKRLIDYYENKISNPRSDG